MKKDFVVFYKCVEDEFDERVIIFKFICSS